MEVIKVDRICKINQDNIAKCREERGVGLNVVQAVEDEKGFINYCLAIHDWQRCSEDFGIGFLKTSEFNENKVFVDRIEHDIDNATTQWLEENGFKYNWDEDEAKYIVRSGVVSCVYGKNDKLLAIGWVYNDHNGYYCHKVWTDINGNTEVRYL